MPRLTRILIPLVLMAASVLFFFLALELALRALDYPRREARILCLDAIMGNVYCPNLSEHLDNTYDSTLLVTTNSEGMADRDYALEKPPGTIRIALLGDSVTASLYTKQENKFKTIWETSLSQSLGRPVEVMNFGIDGTSTWEQLQMFQLRARHYKPDYVVLSFFWGNDVWNNSRSRDKGRPNPLKDEYGEQSWVRNLQVKHRKSIRWLWNNSSAFQFLDTLKDRLETSMDYKRAMQSAQTPVPAAAAIPAEKLAEKVVDTPQPQTETALNLKLELEKRAHEFFIKLGDPAFSWDSKSWELTRELIIKLRDTALKNDARLLLFSIPMYDQLMLPKTLPYAEFRAFLQQNDIGSADAFDTLLGLSPEQKRALYIGDAEHLSDQGHRLIGDTGASALRGFIARAAIKQ